MQSKQPSPTPVPLKMELKAYLKHKAIDNARSLSAEIIARLEESRSRDGSAASQ